MVRRLARWAAAGGWTGIYFLILSNPLLMSGVTFVGVIGFILISWAAYFLWSMVFYLILTPKEAEKRSGEELKEKQVRSWFGWVTSRLHHLSLKAIGYLRARGRILWIYLAFLTLGPIAGVPLVKVRSQSSREALPVLLIGSFLSAPPLLLLSFGIAFHAPIHVWVLELVKKFLAGRLF